MARAADFEDNRFSVVDINLKKKKALYFADEYLKDLWSFNSLDSQSRLREDGTDAGRSVQKTSVQSSPVRLGNISVDFKRGVITARAEPPPSTESTSKLILIWVIVPHTSVVTASVHSEFLL